MSESNSSSSSEPGALNSTPEPPTTAAPAQAKTPPPAPPETKAPEQPEQPEKKRGRGRPRKEDEKPKAEAPKKPEPPTSPPRTKTEKAAEAAMAKAMGFRKAGTPEDPRARILFAKEKQQEAIEEYRRQHPNSNIGDATDPLDCEVRVLDEGLVPGDMLGFMVMGGYYKLAALVEMDEKNIPDPDAFMKLGRRWEEASRYWGVKMSPAGIAMTGAVTSSVVIAAPLLVAGATKLLGGKDEDKPRIDDEAA